MHHFRAVSELKWPRDKCTPGFAGVSVDEALLKVRKDIRKLWVRSRYVRDFTGIVTFSPSVTRPQGRKLTVEVQGVKGTMQVIVQNKGKERTRTTSGLRVGTPLPWFQPLKGQNYKAAALKKVPQPLFLHRRYTKLRSQKHTFGGFSRGITERDLSPSLPTECPLTALRSYELERRDLRGCTSFHLNTEVSEREFSSGNGRKERVLLRDIAPSGETGSEKPTSRWQFCSHMDTHFAS